MGRGEEPLPLDRAPTDWKDGCGKSAWPVWREGVDASALPTPIGLSGVKYPVSPFPQFPCQTFLCHDFVLLCLPCFAPFFASWRQFEPGKWLLSELFRPENEACPCPKRN